MPGLRGNTTPGNRKYRDRFRSLGGVPPGSRFLTKPESTRYPKPESQAMTVQLSDASRLSVAQITALSPRDLAQLQSDASHALAQAKGVKDAIDGAIAVKYEESARVQRERLDKDTGTVHFVDDGIRVTCETSKRVEWDQKALAEITRRIAEQGDDPAEYVEVAYRVPERKYTAWPEHIREVFAPARTLKPGKLTVKLSAVEAGAA